MKNKLTFLFIIFSILVLGGCQTTLPIQPYSFTFPATENINFNIEIDNLLVAIQPGEDAHIAITYDDLPGDQRQILIDDQNGTFTISSRAKISPRTLQILLPPESNFTLAAFNTDISINNLAGEMNVHTIDGDISASNLSGLVRLKSARGNVTLNDSKGELSILGEHGILTLNADHGTVNAANVVGDILYNGQILAEDDVFLETDRGAVSAVLVDSNDAYINIWTANGTVTCQVDQIEMTSITCQRTPASPRGKFQIKTVWGAIRVKAQ